MQSPYRLWLHVRELVQLERITFRADLLSEEICSSYCSESDTFLMNYTIRIQLFIAGLSNYGIGAVAYQIIVLLYRT